MNKAELLAALQLQCWKVYDNPVPFGGVKSAEPNTDAQAAGAAWASAQDSDGMYFSGDANEYKWGTVQMAPRGTRKTQNIHLLVTDEGTANEEATLVGSPVDLPVGDTLNALVYLEDQKAAGDWVWYEYDSGRSDLGWFTILAGIDNGNGTESEKRYRIYKDGQGNPAHAEIV